MQINFGFEYQLKIRKKVRTLFSFLIILFLYRATAQVNYVGNPSFEEHCTQGWVSYWPGLDTLVCNPGTLASTCPNNGLAPLNSLTYQIAKSGGSYMICGLFLPNNGQRGFLKNRLIKQLTKDKIYCVTFYVNLTTKSSCGMDGFQAYFGSKLLDTISVCPTSSLNLVPQISNPTGNIITDTLNWTPIQGTFTATGDEVYMVIGNFKSDAATNTVVINPTYLPLAFTDVCIDDVSCVPIDLPADAGPNKPFFAGDSVFIGRTPNIGIDYACAWYQLPSTATPIATVAGLWVKPVVTSTYVVKQQLWCSGIKYDTVVVYKDAVGIKDLEVYLQNINLFPNPANNKLSIQFTQASISSSIKTITMYNQLAEVIDTPISSMAEDQLQMDCSNLIAGVYYIRFEIESGGSFVKRFVVGR